MIKVYKASFEESEISLNIFAPDANRALHELIYWLHSQPNESDARSVKIRQLTDWELQVQPQLADATKANMSGIGWWIDHRQGWIVGPSDGEPRGSLNPPHTDVMCFRCSGPDFPELLVFATSLQQACAIFNERSRDAFGWDGELETMRRFVHWLLVGPQVTLREDMDAGLTGVGRECEDGFWRIFAPDHERSLEAG